MGSIGILYCRGSIEVGTHTETLQNLELRVTNICGPLFGLRASAQSLQRCKLRTKLKTLKK